MSKIITLVGVIASLTVLIICIVSPEAFKPIYYRTVTILFWACCTLNGALRFLEKTVDDE